MNKLPVRAWIYMVLCLSGDEELLREDVWLWMYLWQFNALRRLDRHNIGFDTWLQTCRRCNKLADEDR